MDYRIKPLGRVCAASGELLEPGSLCHSVVLREGDEWKRLDFAPGNWTGAPEGTIGTWTCRVPQPDAKPAKIDPDALMRYLEQLTEEARPDREPLRYVLALLLVRKRRLEIEETRSDDEGEALVFNGLRGEGRFEVADPQLDEEAVSALQAELDLRLSVGWE